MITVLLWLLAAGLVAIVVYTIGRLLLDVRALFAERSRGAAGGALPPLTRDVKALSIAAQLGFLVALVAVFGFLWSNFLARANQINLNLSFDFLDQPGNISIADNPLTPADTVSEAITAAFGNTIRIIVVGIPLALAVGIGIGIARLSSNWLLAKMATGYVEFFRNIPPLVVIVFVWSAFLQLPTAQEPWRPFGGWLIINNSRFAIPSVKGLDNFETYRWLLLVALIAAIAIGWWRTRVFNLTGAPHRRALWAVGVFLAIAVVGFVALGGPAEPSKPLLDETGRIYTDGFRIQMPYAALTLALIIYTSTHISEIVRGSILAVPKGQSEAGNALALSAIQRYRFVILPQALRIAFPPLINQFLNFSKNSSLAIAIGFAETTSVINNLFGQSQPVPQLVLILALLYLTLSLILSAIGNVINSRLQIVGR